VFDDDIVSPAHQMILPARFVVTSRIHRQVRALAPLPGVSPVIDPAARHAGQRAVRDVRADLGEHLRLSQVAAPASALWLRECSSCMYVSTRQMSTSIRRLLDCNAAVPTYIRRMLVVNPRMNVVQRHGNACSRALRARKRRLYLSQRALPAFNRCATTNRRRQPVRMRGPHARRRCMNVRKRRGNTCNPRMY
jgi:hypothetical protein